MEPAFTPSKSPSLGGGQWIVWTFILVVILFISWGTYRVYRYYSPFVTELTLTGTYSDTVISPNQYHYSGLIKFYGTANPLQVSLGTVASYFPAGTLQKNDSYNVMLQNTTLNPIYVCFDNTRYTLTSTLTTVLLSGSISYFVLPANTSLFLSMAYVSSSSVILF